MRVRRCSSSILRKKIMDAEREGRLALGGIHTRLPRAQWRFMQVNSGQDSVWCHWRICRRHSRIMVTMLEDMKIPRRDAVRSMWAAGAIGWVLATRGTRRRSVRMPGRNRRGRRDGAGAVVEAVGGLPVSTADAGAIMFQNAMGLVCDLAGDSGDPVSHEERVLCITGIHLCRYDTGRLSQRSQYRRYRRRGILLRKDAPTRAPLHIAGRYRSHAERPFDAQEKIA